jgi:hypothetical protein
MHLEELRPVTDGSCRERVVGRLAGLDTKYGIRLAEDSGLWGYFDEGGFAPRADAFPFSLARLQTLY